MSRASEYNFTTLRVSQAFVSLQCQPENGRKPISLAWIGDLSADKPLFILDIFDHDAQLFIDNRACRSLADGAVAFDDFLLMAEPVESGPH